MKDFAKDDGAMYNSVMCKGLLTPLSAYLQGLCADEETDDVFCQALYEAYQADSSPDKHQSISLEQPASELGVLL